MERVFKGRGMDGIKINLNFAGMVSIPAYRTWVIFVYHLTKFSLLLVAGLVLGHNVINIPQLKPPFFTDGHPFIKVCCLS